MVGRRIKAARFPVVKSRRQLRLQGHRVAQQGRWSWSRPAASRHPWAMRETSSRSAISGTGKSRIALGLGVAAFQKGPSVETSISSRLHWSDQAHRGQRFSSSSLRFLQEIGSLQASDRRRCSASCSCRRPADELLIEVYSRRYERGSTLVTTNLPFDEWTEVFGSERLTGALLDRLTCRVDILDTVCASALPWLSSSESRRRQTPTSN